MPHLELNDVEQIVHLLAQAGDPTIEMSVADRRRMLLRGIGQLIDADIWMWSIVTINPSLHGDFMSFCMIDGGWLNEAERTRVFNLLTNPQFNASAQRPFTDAIRDCRYTTFVPQELLTNTTWEDWRTTGFEHFLLSTYPVSQDVASCIGYHRRLGKTGFTERDRMIVHAVYQQVDWLHREGTDVPAKHKVVDLSRREREVLLNVLAGDSRKQIAHKLNLSEHTVGDYLKSIYKHFDVNSRAELLSHFISGGQK